MTKLKPVSLPEYLVRWPPPLQDAAIALRTSRKAVAAAERKLMAAFRKQYKRGQTFKTSSGEIVEFSGVLTLGICGHLLVRMRDGSNYCLAAITPIKQ